MRQERGAHDGGSRIREVIFAGLIIARFVMLETEVRDLIAEREQKMIFAIMPGAEQRARFTNELSVFLDKIGRRVQGFVAVGGDVEIMRGCRTGTEFDAPEVTSGEDRRVDERRQ